MDIYVRDDDGNYLLVVGVNFDFEAQEGDSILIALKSGKGKEKRISSFKYKVLAIPMGSDIYVEQVFLKVKITRAGNWYTGEVGKIFEVRPVRGVGFAGENYLVVGTDQHIAKTDCEEVK